MLFARALPRPARLLLVAGLCRFGAVEATSVNVGLEASFSTPPFLLELLETAAQENVTAYFPLLDRIAEGRFAECATEKELYTTFLDVLREDGHLSKPEALATFQMAVSIHAAAPRIQAHYQYYESAVAPLLPAAQDAACPNWVHHEGKQYCSPTLQRAQQDFEGSAEEDPQELLPFEHALALSSELPAATLYVDVNSPAMGMFHQELVEMARAGRVSYRVRYRPSPDAGEVRPLAMSGYGVELALKRTDYIVIDDRAGKEDDGSGDAAAADDNGKAGVGLDSEEEIDDLKPLSSSQLLGLGLKAASYVMNSTDRFAALERLSQDFPKHSYAISKMNVSQEFLAEHIANRAAFLGAGYNVVWMNGLQIDTRSMDAFALLDRLRQEREVIEDMRGVGLEAPQAISLLSHRAITQAQTADDAQRYDYRDTLEGGQTIIWLNNIEKDKRYEEWPTQAAMLLQPSYPGSLPQVRRDIHNVILPLNLANASDIEEATHTLQMLVKREVPVRFGIVPMLLSPESKKQAKAAYYLQDTYGLGGVMEYLESSADGRFDQSKLKKVVSARKLRKDKTPLEVSEVIEGDEYESRVSSAHQYLRRLGAAGVSPPLFVNGIAMPRNEIWMQAMSGRVSMDMQFVMRQVYEGILSEDMWIAGGFLGLAATHRNALIIPEDEDMEKVIDISKVLSLHHDLYENLPKVAASADVSQETWSHVIVAADLDSEDGVKLANAALAWRDDQPGAEIVLLHNGLSSAESNVVSAKLFSASSDGSKLGLEETQKVLGSDASGQGSLNEMAQTFWQRFVPLTEEVGLKTGENGVILNGRVIRHLEGDDVFDAEAFSQLLAYEQEKRILPVREAMVDLQFQDRIQSPLALSQITSKLALVGKSDVPEGIFGNTPQIRMDMFKDWASNHTAITFGDAATASTQIVAAVDPTSEIAQRWIPMLRALSELEGVHTTLFLNPRERMEELPVKRFYRYLLASQPHFDAEGAVARPTASFDGLPKKALLNLGMDVPPAWLVAPRESAHDLDNIRLSSVRSGDVEATYELQHILIEGHSREAESGKPPRGVQLLLQGGLSPRADVADTLIMSNLGYFQFKASPGHWRIALKGGASEDIFRIDNVGAGGYSSEVAAAAGARAVTLMSFQGLTLFPTLSRRPGREADDVLGGEAPARPGSAGAYVAKASNLASGLLSNLGMGKRKSSEHADINIFSVASGHLYERMLNIMMVSVMRHTQHSVKFWFIEQFLSPSFKKTLPVMAGAYGFEYELVTYKWPHWLRGQKEKQREIWGYKILFLDVLFPLSLDKVIFVDADQVVRADMHELVELDLGGAPYGFTPMCDSREEMEGFRFWKQGYWKNFLRGRPYHISALYVVDLHEFRRIAAGDRLRQQYHQLSADPQSLANLDQDLPNNMQSMLPIHSLPQDWLWCETWCSDEALTSAKTIDLCNNPLTKEPKLDRARRQVPEWTVYDDEIAEVVRRGAGDGAGENVQEQLDRAGDAALEEDRGDGPGEARDEEKKPASVRDEL